MTTAKWTSIQDRSTIHAILMQDLMKRDVCSYGVEMALQYAMPLNEWTIYSTIR